MIVTEDNDALTAKRAYAPVTDREEEDAEHGQALPAYSAGTGTSTVQGAPSPPPSVQPTQELPDNAKSTVQFPSGGGGGRPPPLMPYDAYDGHYALTHLQMQQRGERIARKRFLKALCVAILVYLLIWMFVQSVADLVGKHGWDDWERGRPGAGDGNIVECINGDDWSPSPLLVQRSAATSSQHPSQDPDPERSIPSSPPSASPTSPTRWPYPAPPYLAYATFSLPVSADLLYFLSRGSTHGAIRIDVDPSLRGDKEGANNVTVKIVASYYTNRALERATVCQLKRNNGKGWEHGVGVFGPAWNRGGFRDHVRFDLTVLLPSSSSPLLIKALQTEFSNFAHEIADLERDVVFEKLDVRTTNANFNAGSLFAKNAVIRSTNAPITGSYNTSGSLKLITSNSPINAQVTLISNDKGNGKTELELKTTNGPLTVPITLSTTSSSPNYIINARTSNSPLKLSLTYPSPPPRSPTISLTARTSNNHASVKLGAAYEGTFDISTSNSRAEVDTGRDIEDPWGEGRKRTVSFKTLPGPRARQVRGAVWWGKGRGDEEKVKRGTVEVRTSNGPVGLQLY